MPPRCESTGRRLFRWRIPGSRRAPSRGSLAEAAGVVSACSASSAATRVYISSTARRATSRRRRASACDFSASSFCRGFRLAVEDLRLLGEHQHDAERQPRDDHEQERHDGHDDRQCAFEPAGSAARAPGSPGPDRLIVEKSLEIIGHLARGGIAARRVFGHRLQDDRFQVERDLGLESARPRAARPGRFSEAGPGGSILRTAGAG